MTDIKEMLEEHKKWLESGGIEGKKFVLVKQNLIGADMQYADLRYAILRDTDLRYAILRDTDLKGADLRDTDLKGASMQGADLKYAILRDTDLKGADLRDTDLKGADLRRSDLKGASMQGADLRGANLNYSCFPLWCGTNGVEVDRRIFLQLLAHVCAVDVDDEECKELQKTLMPFALASHVAKYLFDKGA